MAQAGPATTPAPEHRFREVLGHYPTGVVVVTGLHPDGEALAMAVGTFTSVSLDPPLVAFLPMKTARTFARLQECDALCVNILTGDQEDLCRTIAARWRDKLADVGWEPSPAGAPLLAESLAWLDVRIDRVVEGGDHWIVLCRVLDLAVQNPAPPLIFFQGGYGQFAVRSLVARATALASGAHRRAVAAAARSQDVLVDVAERLGCECALLAHLGEDEIVTVATATGAGIVGEAPLGELLPTIPPLGESAVFALPEPAQRRWLAKAVGADEEELAVYRDRLEFCRAHGYFLSQVTQEQESPYRHIARVREHYARSGLTPARFRELRRHLQSASLDYAVPVLDPLRAYDIGSVVVPLQDVDGTWAFAVRASQLPRPATGEAVAGWVALLRTAAVRVEARLAAQPAL